MSFENNETYKLLLKLKCVCISIIIFAFHNILCRQGQSKSLCYFYIMKSIIIALSFY